MKYLITGGCGFLGSNVASEVLRRQEALVIFDNLSRIGSTQNLEWLRQQGPLEFVHGDIRNRHDVDFAIARHCPEVVFHLAGQVAMTTSLQQPRLDFEINALGSFQLLEALRQYAPHAAVVYSSTNKVYGDLASLEYQETATRYATPKFPNGLPESTPLQFESPYGCSKGAADQYMLDYHRMFGLRTVVFRHSSMYGDRQFATFDQGWIGWFCQQALLTRENRLPKPFTISGNGKQVRDVLHNDDMVALYFRAAERIESVQGQAFNIGGGMANSLSLLELFALLSEELGVTLKFESLPQRASDQKVFVADIRKAKEKLGWTPQISAKEGIRRSLSWNKKTLSL